jgi:hypothetical protein
MRHVLLLLALALSSVGCLATPVGVSRTENPNISAELLFTHDGCKIYRFRDGPVPVYYADCRSPAGASTSTSTSWHIQCGKNCERPMLLSTAQ